MKTLKDEIVEALNESSGIAREHAAHNAIHKNYEVEDMCLGLKEKFELIAAKVESARCENCANYYENFSHCEYDGSYQEPNSFCWNFEQKEK